MRTKVQGDGRARRAAGRLALVALLSALACAALLPYARQAARAQVRAPRTVTPQPVRPQTRGGATPVQTPVPTPTPAVTASRIQPASVV
ncbi:MAG TPA: hypothetical protein VGP08_18005, partial [Pyrinomonadaceae bacterium]|nr:hypothetical protein [Pyrinomonadaceae bacterium]